MGIFLNFTLAPTRISPSEWEQTYEDALKIADKCDLLDKIIAERNGVRYAFSRKTTERIVYDKGLGFAAYGTLTSGYNMEDFALFRSLDFYQNELILHAENICSNSSGNWTAFGNCGKGVFPNWYKVMEKLDALAYKAVNVLFVISICVADDGINFLLEGSKVTIVFCGQLPLDKFPKTFYQVEIWAVWWNVFEVDAQLPGKIPHDLAFLVPCVVKHQVDFLLPIRCRNLAQHGAYFCGGYVAVICHNQYFLGNIVHGPKDVMAHPARERHDKTPCPAVDTPKETAAHDKVGGIQEQQGNIPLLRLFH